MRSLADKPNKTWPEPDLNTSNRIRVVHISDFHMDAHYVPNTVADCEYLVCCRPESHLFMAPGKKSNVSAAYWGTPNGQCDAPRSLVEEAVRFAASLNPDAVLWTGDNSDHDANITRAQEINNTQFITKLFQDALNEDVLVYSTIGNHETYPMEMWDFFGDGNDPFKNEISDAWEKWIGLNGSAIFKQNGFYSTYNEKIGTRIISLNTQACNSENLYLLRDPTDPRQHAHNGWLLSFKKPRTMTNWVYIIGHVASGIKKLFQPVV